MKRWQRFLKKLEQALLSSTVTIHQCLPCVQERVRVLHRPKFSLWIWHFAWFEAFYIVSSFRFKGENYPRLARSHSLTHSSAAFAQVKANKRASQDRRHGRSWKKQRKIHEKPFRKRVASWQSFSFRKEVSVSTSSHVWNFKWIALPWKHGACKQVQCWNMCVSSSLTSRTLFFDRRVRNAHELKLSWSPVWC